MLEVPRTFETSYGRGCRQGFFFLLRSNTSHARCPTSVTMRMEIAISMRKFFHSSVSPFRKSGCGRELLFFPWRYWCITLVFEKTARLMPQGDRYYPCAAAGIPSHLFGATQFGVEGQVMRASTDSLVKLNDVTQQGEVYLVFWVIGLGYCTLHRVSMPKCRRAKVYFLDILRCHRRDSPVQVTMSAFPACRGIHETAPFKMSPASAHTTVVDELFSEVDGHGSGCNAWAIVGVQQIFFAVHSFALAASHLTTTWAVRQTPFQNSS